MFTNIVGTQECGKTWIAQYMSRYLAKMGCPISVYDPKIISSNSPKKAEWKADFITNDVNTFRKHVWTSTDEYFSFDEAVILENKKMDWQLTTMLRCMGHFGSFISQSLVQMPRTTRKMSAGVIALHQGRVDSKYLADDYGDHFDSCKDFAAGDFAISCPAHRFKAIGNSYSEKDLKHIEDYCDLLLETKPDTDMEVAEQHGCYGVPNWEYLKQKELIL
jgi:hypothetical protein